MRLIPLPHSKKRGQILFLVVLMTMTMASILTFVVHTGLLVHAKINLQNAADLAAYSGASVQARHLTHIGYLNYEMRRQLKKFLYRYYVLGQNNQPSHPTSAPGRNQPREYYVVENGTIKKPIEVPSVCMTWEAGQNVCRIFKVPKVLPNYNPIIDRNPISKATYETLRDIEKKKVLGCLGAGQANRQLLYYWLFNTDPEQTELSQVIETLKTQNPNDPNLPRILKRQDLLKTAAFGLGIYPKNLILSARIRTLESFVNAPSKTDVGIGDIKPMQTSMTAWPKNERTVAAFLSAYSTLGSALYGDQLKMTELMPGSSDRARLLELKEETSGFTVFATDFAIDNCSSPAPTTGAPPDEAECVQCITPLEIKKKNGAGGLPIGFYKEPTTLTYYAIKLDATVQLPFSPLRAPLELTAVAAARPFGSRIGPKIGFEHYGVKVPTSIASGVINPNQVQNRCNSGTTAGLCTDPIPNLPIKADGDVPLTLSNGYNMLDVVWPLYNAIAPVDGAGNPSGAIPTIFTIADLERAYQVAMAPTPWEIGQYIFPNDQSPEDPFVKHFNQGGNPDNWLYPIWAPIVNPEGGKSAQDLLTELISNAIPETSDDDPVMPTKVREALIQGVLSYANQKLAANMGEDNEGFNVVRLRDPTKHVILQPGASPKIGPKIGGTGSISPDILAVDLEDIRTSYVPKRDPDISNAKRSYYSVKIVPIKDLKQGSMTVFKSKDGDSIGNFSNKLQDLKTNNSADIEKVQH